MVFKNALAQRQPKITERGSIDQITGEYTYDPDYLKQQALAKLGQTIQLKMAHDAKMQAAQEHNQTLLTIGAGHDAARLAAQAAAAAARPAKEDTYTNEGVAADGSQVVTGKNGMRYLLRPDANGMPIYTPYTGAFTPKSAFEKNVEAAT